MGRWYLTGDNRIAITGGTMCLDEGDNGPQTYQCTTGNTNQSQSPRCALVAQLKLSLVRQWLPHLILVHGPDLYIVKCLDVFLHRPSWPDGSRPVERQHQPLCDRDGRPGLRRCPSPAVGRTLPSSQA